jgi:DNA-damage-inducible protein D
MLEIWYNAADLGVTPSQLTKGGLLSDLTLFHFDDGRQSFEDLGKPNGIRYWLESDLMSALEYQTGASFRKVITRAMQACLSLGIPTEENFILQDGQYKLTRFACYLIAMNGDPKKPQVAAAQVYFAALAETFRHHLQHAESIDRVLIRREMTDGLKTLASTAKSHGVQNYAYFQNAGYRGMYNMDLARLTAFKGVDGDKEMLLDRMGKDELAANLFRITQTDAKIKNQQLHGQRTLENAAFEVGKTVRKTMMEISGTAPEHLPIADHIKDVKKALKETSKKFKKLDGSKKKISGQGASGDQPVT